MKNLFRASVFIIATFLLPNFVSAINLLNPNNEGVVIFDSTQETEDLILTAGTTVNINGKTGDGAIIAAKEVNLSSDFFNHVIALAGKISVKGNIEGDLIAVADEVIIEPGSKIRGDVLIYGSSNVYIGGEVGGDLVTKTGSTLTISGTIRGKTDFQRVENLTVTSTAQIEGDIKGLVNNSTNLSGEAKILGQNQISNTSTHQKTTATTINILLMFVSILVFMAFLRIIAPKFTDSAREKAFADPLKSLGYGALTFFGGIFVTIISFVLEFTYLIGIFLVLSGFMLCLLGVLFSYVWLADALTNKKLNIYFASILGLSLFLALNLLPAIAIFAYTLVFLIGLGATSISALNLARNNDK